MTDEIKPWTLKNITPEVRNAAVAAAERDRVMIGEWVSRAILEKVKADQNQNRSPTVVEQPPDTPLPSLAELVAISATLGASEMNPGLKKLLTGTVRDQIQAIRHRYRP